MIRAYEFHRAEAPRFPTRETCWKTYKVCIVLAADARRPRESGGTGRRFWFAPPLWAVRVDKDGDVHRLTLLVDQTMATLGTIEVTQQAIASSPRPAAARAGDRPEDPAPRADGRALEGLGPADTFPVPASRLRRMRDGPRPE
jgi:hypothetical protein